MVKKILGCILFSCSMLAMISNEEIIQGAQLLSDHEFLKKITDVYPEMHRLTEAVKASPESQALDNEHSPSKKLFGKQYIEFDRTAVGILAVKWVLANQYETFTAGQPEALKLSRESFNELRDSTLLLAKKKQLLPLITSLAFNDLGKVINFCKQVEERRKNKEVDHDTVLLSALDKYSDLVPSFTKLDKDEQEMILKGMKAQFNLGQFVQAENLPANLRGLKNLSESELNFHNLHTLFDVSGARGHVFSQGSLVLNEPTYQSFVMAFKALNSIPVSTELNVLTHAYDDYLRTRAQRLYNKSFSTPEERAITRLAFMTRVDIAMEFDMVKQTFKELPAGAQALLIDELNKTGISDCGILLYYAPAVLVNAKAAFKHNLHEGIKLALLYLKDAFELARAKIPSEKRQGVFVVDCTPLAEKIKNPTELQKYFIDGLESVGCEARIILQLIRSNDY